MLDENAAQGAVLDLATRPPPPQRTKRSSQIDLLGLDASPGGRVNQGLPSSLSWQAGARRRVRAVTDAMAPRLVSSTHEPVAAVGRGIRRYVRVLLENWGLDDEVVEGAELAADTLRP
jgi:hypothetical protein